MNRCPICGRPVASFFDHVDIECQLWPSDWTMQDLKIPEQGEERGEQSNQGQD